MIRWGVPIVLAAAGVSAYVTRPRIDADSVSSAQYGKPTMPPGRLNETLQAAGFAIGAGALSLVSKALLNTMCETEINGKHKLLQPVLDRPRGVPLITVSNHVSTIDDPILLCLVTPTAVLLNPSKARYGLCSEEYCFKDRFSSAFANLMRVMPVQRGGGIDHPFFEEFVAKAKRGAWVHIFAGTVQRSGQFISWLATLVLCLSFVRFL